MKRSSNKIAGFEDEGRCRISPGLMDDHDCFGYPLLASLLGHFLLPTFVAGVNSTVPIAAIPYIPTQEYQQPLVRETSRPIHHSNVFRYRPISSALLVLRPGLSLHLDQNLPHPSPRFRSGGARNDGDAGLADVSTLGDVRCSHTLIDWTSSPPTLGNEPGFGGCKCFDPTVRSARRRIGAIVQLDLLTLPLLALAWIG